METGLGPEPPLLQGGNYDSTSLTCVGGNALVYYFDPGVSVNARSYTIDLLVQNFDTVNAITISPNLNLGAGVSVPANTSQQVSFSVVGDGVNDIRLEFRVLNAMTALNVVAKNPVIFDTVSLTNLIPSGSLNFASGWSIGGGIGSVTVNQGQPTPGSSPRDPEINLRWSDDGGHVWSNIHTVGAGQMGKFLTRVIWRRLGRSRDRVYEVSVTDPIPWRLLEADLIASPGFVPQERLAKTYQKVT
jgi:hypothetical protein